MKTSYIIGGLCLLIIAIGSYFYLRPSPSVQGIGSSSEIKLYKEYGFITWKEKDATEYKRVSDDETVLPNDVYVKTVDGRGYVLLPDNSSIALDKNTEVLISYHPEGTSIIQTLGSTYHRVEALVGGTTYEVRTPNTLASVRGTKLMVSYDKNTGTSKVDVTEHKVFVSTLDATTTPEVIEEGNSATVDVNATTTPISRGKTDSTKNPWLAQNLLIDTALEQGKDRAETLKTLLDNMRTIKAEQDVDGVKETDSDTLKRVQEAIQETKRELDDSPSTEPEPKTEDRSTDEKPTADTTRTETKPTTTATVTGSDTTKVTTPIVKIDEEKFFDTFNTMFVNNFYLDESDTPCQSSLTAEARVRLVSSYATQSGYPFTSATLLSFANAINTYCAVKDPSVKARLQAQFDSEFPFNE